MDPGARRRACEEFRAKLRRDTGTDLPSAFCQVILETCFQGKRGEQVSLESDPGLFYASLGAAISAGNLVIANHVKVAVWCWRQAAEVHNDPVAMTELAGFYYEGEGVAEDRAQAVYWYQKAADLGDAAAKATLGTALVYGDPPWVAKDAVRGLGLLREAVELGYGAALYLCVLCYLKGMGVEKDAAHAVALLLKAATQDPASTDPDATAAAQLELAHCYKDGNGVEADTVQAALWCHRAATGGDAAAVKLLPIIRSCDFCGKTPARQHCQRCRKVRYCGAACQAGHWKRETDPHKGHCRRRAAEASEEGTAPGSGGASSSRAS